MSISRKALLREPRPMSSNSPELERIIALQRARLARHRVLTPQEISLHENRKPSRGSNGDSDQGPKATDHVPSRQVLHKRQREIKNRIKTNWENLIQRISQYDPGEGDVLDLETLEIVEDKGHLKSLSEKQSNHIWHEDYDDQREMKLRNMRIRSKASHKLEILRHSQLNPEKDDLLLVSGPSDTRPIVHADQLAAHRQLHSQDSSKDPQVHRNSRAVVLKRLLAARSKRLEKGSNYGDQEHSSNKEMRHNGTSENGKSAEAEAEAETEEEYYRFLNDSETDLTDVSSLSEENFEEARGAISDLSTVNPTDSPSKKIKHSSLPAFDSPLKKKSGNASGALVVSLLSDEETSDADSDNDNTEYHTSSSIFVSRHSPGKNSTKKAFALTTPPRSGIKIGPLSSDDEDIGELLRKLSRRDSPAKVPQTEIAADDDLERSPLLSKKREQAMDFENTATKRHSPTKVKGTRTPL